MAQSFPLGRLSGQLDKLYEFEREPVGDDHLKSGRYFAAMFSGEHIAGTEFVIGALFVQWGARADELIWGLLLGNLLAVLSWAFVCAPISVRVRLTLYWYARQIIGPGLTVIYNLVNATLYCCLAAAMIGVSASAIGLACSRIGFRFRHPQLDDILPNSVGWVVIVLLVGSLVVVLAIAGFKRLSQFSAVCSPWMFPIFLGGALTTLPKLGEIHNVGDLWNVAQNTIWTGLPLKSKATLPLILKGDLHDGLVTPALTAKLAGIPGSPIKLSSSAILHVQRPGQLWRIVDGDTTYLIGDQEGRLRISEILKERLGFWHILFFAWFCNLAMHIGLSDMAVFRYARHWTYGFYSAFGMYLGHYVAWICAGVMGAVIWGELNPGKMADSAVGIAGLVCVLLAGWTTANPTIYRAGLALQIITPNWPRWKVTLAAGAITTVVALFPAIFMKLLDFVAIYGLMLMPVGAVIIVEHWLFPFLGLNQYWTDRQGRAINPAALLTWLAVLAICLPFEQFTGGRINSPMAMLGIPLFFRWLPGWFIAAGLYVALAALMGARAGISKQGEENSRPCRPIQPVAIESVPKTFRPLDGATWLAGAMALLALVVCIALPLKVFMGGGRPEVYAENMALCNKGLIVASIIYFIAGSYWVARRESSRGTQ